MGSSPALEVDRGCAENLVDGLGFKGLWQHPAPQDPRMEDPLEALEEHLRSLSPPGLRPPVEPKQYTSLRYTDLLTVAGGLHAHRAHLTWRPTTGSVGDSFDYAKAESIIGLYKAEVINRRDRWDSLEQVESETMRWLAWFNHARIYEALGDIPPTEFEAKLSHSTPPEPTAGASNTHTPPRRT